MPANEFFGLSRRKFTDAELKRLAQAVAKALRDAVNTAQGERQPTTPCATTHDAV